MGQVKGFLLVVLVAGGGILLIGSVAAGGYYLAAEIGTEAINLPLIIIGGVILLLTVLGLLTYGFSFLDLANRDEALALPSGSVRAVIALMLLVIFAIVAIFLYSDIAKSGRIQRMDNVSESVLANLKQNMAIIAYEPMAMKPEGPRKGEPAPKEPQPNLPEQKTDAKQDTKETPPPAAAPSTKGPNAQKKGNAAAKQAPPVVKAAAAPETQKSETVVYRVFYRDAVSSQGADIAKQLIVLLGTLVTAVASFYFGSSSIAAATKQRDRVGGPDAKAVSPRELKPNTSNQPLTITGTNLSNVVGVELTFDGQEPILAEGVSASDAKVECKVTTKANTKAGPWTVTVSDNANNASRIPNIITVAAKPPEPAAEPPPGRTAVPEIAKVDASALQANGQSRPVKISGKNLTDIKTVKFVPDDGIAVGDITPGSGDEITVAVTIGNATPPKRMVSVVNKAGAESKAVEVSLTV